RDEQRGREPGGGADDTAQRDARILRGVRQSTVDAQPDGDIRGEAVVVRQRVAERLGVAAAVVEVDGGNAANSGCGLVGQVTCVHVYRPSQEAGVVAAEDEGAGAGLGQPAARQKAGVDSQAVETRSVDVNDDLAGGARSRNGAAGDRGAATACRHKDAAGLEGKRAGETQTRRGGTPWGVG